MFRPSCRIRTEVSNAVEYVRAQGGVLPDDAVAQQTAAGAQLRHLPDDAILEDYYSPELLPCPPNVVRVDSLQELETALYALGRMHGGIRRHVVNQSIWHERGHKLPADAVGFAYSGLRLTVLTSIVQKTWWGKRMWCNFRPGAQQAGPKRPITKLAVASIIAGPIASDGDEAQLVAMGYRGRADVAQHIANASRPQLASLMMPEGF